MLGISFPATPPTFAPLSGVCDAGAAAEGAAVEEEVRGAPGAGAAAAGRQTGAAESTEGQPRAGRCESLRRLSRCRLPGCHDDVDLNRSGRGPAQCFRFSNDSKAEILLLLFIVNP